MVFKYKILNNSVAQFQKKVRKTKKSPPNAMQIVLVFFKIRIISLLHPYGAHTACTNWKKLAVSETLKGSQMVGIRLTNEGDYYELYWVMSGSEN